jgi:hypothetical protein
VGSVIQPIIDYVGRSALLTVQQLVILLGPLLILAFILDQLSQFVRARAARILSLDVYTYLTAPGVMVHELGHAFFCVIFRHRIIRMRLFRPGSDGTLGSVQHSYNPRSTYQRIGNFFIGTGPIWFGSTMVCVLAWFLLGPTASDAVRHMSTSDDPANLPGVLLQVTGLAWQLFTSLLRPAVVSSRQFWIFAYLMFCIGSHITLSRPDINGAARGFVSLVAFVFLFNLLTLSVDGQLSLRACRRLLQDSVVFYAGMSLVVCLNLALAAILFLMSFLLRIIR